MTKIHIAWCHGIKHAELKARRDRSITDGSNEQSSTNKMVVEDRGYPDKAVSIILRDKYGSRRDLEQLVWN